MKVMLIHCRYRQKGGEDTVVREEEALLQAAGISTVVLEFNNGGWKDLVQLPFNLGAYRRVRRMLALEKPDLVHIHNLHFAASASVLYAVKRSGVPMVMTLHNYRLLCPSGTLFHKGHLFTASLRERFPWTAVRRGVYRGSRVLTAWLAFSNWLHQKLGSWKLPNRYILLTPHARKLFLESKLDLKEKQLVVKPNFSSFTPPPAIPRQEHFLYAGRLTEEKGVRLLLKVFSKNGKPLRIAGSGPLEAEVLACTNAFPNICYLGALSPAALANGLASATALVFPSLWFEGMPLTIIEALACGTPVIASNLGAMETMISNGINGLHFEAGSESSLEAAIGHWKKLSPAEKQSCSYQSRAAYEENYTPEKNIRQLLRIYHNLLEPDTEASMVSAALELTTQTV